MLSDSTQNRDNAKVFVAKRIEKGRIITPSTMNTIYCTKRGISNENLRLLKTLSGIAGMTIAKRADDRESLRYG